MIYKQGDRIVANLDGVNSRATIAKILAQDLYIIVTGAQARRIITRSQIVRGLERTKDIIVTCNKKKPMNYRANWNDEFKAIPRNALINGETVPFCKFLWDDQIQKLELKYGEFSFQSIGAKDFDDAFAQAIRLVLESK